MVKSSKQIIILKLFFLVLLLLYSCRAEEEYMHGNKRGEYLNMTTKTLNELNKSHQFKRAFMKIPKRVNQNNLFGRSAMEDQYGFRFVDAPIKIIEKDGKIYYTIQIISDDNVDGKIENLILNADDSSEEIGYIIKYNSSKVEDKTDLEIVDDGIEKIIPLSSITNEASRFITVNYSLCSGIPYNCYGTICGFGQMNIWASEFPSGNNHPGYTEGGGSGGGTSSGSTGGSSSSGGKVRTPTAPNNCPGCPTLSGDEDCNTSKEDLKTLFPNASDSDMETLASVLNEYGKDFGIDSKEKLQHFLAQAGHEVGEFASGLSQTESLHYTTENRLKKVFKQYFWQSETDTINKRNPADYLNNSTIVANYVYCCRMGNGDEESGDGYKYRGRGIFQLTGKKNYLDFKTWYNDKYDPDIDFVDTPNLISENDTLSVLSALWFYKTRVIDKITIDDTSTVKAITMKVNGGTNGLTHREEIHTKAKDSIDCR